MPELPEVETVRRGLEPYLRGARLGEVELRRPDLRFPIPPHFAETLTGATVEAVERRAKYLLLRLSNGWTWLSHLGMTGAWRFRDFRFKEPSRYYEPDAAEKHDHVLVDIDHPAEGRMTLIYNDARRFGFMDLFQRDDESPYLRDLGPEPLSNSFDAPYLARRFSGRTAPAKAALLDQRIVAGLGNIYVSEALHRAHIRPERAIGTLVDAAGRPAPELELLPAAIRNVLGEAIEAGGSTLRDFRAADGTSGYFQHHFSVYDRAGEPCPTPGCSGTIARIVQSGRSSFFCPVCQH